MRRLAGSSALLVACAALLAWTPGCGSTSPPREASATLDDPSRKPEPLTVPQLGITTAVATPALLLPGPGPRPALESVHGVGLPTEESCARCHQEIAAEWSGSLHRHAWNNDYFSRSYASEPQPFCRGCHAPSADPKSEPDQAARETGVGCTTCHVVPAGIVGSRELAARQDGHAVLGDARLATPAACGGCHDFAFPDQAGFSTGPMQDTLGEHSRSAASATSCQGCHMVPVPSRGAPDGRTHRSHGFRVQGDRAMLAQAVELRSAELTKGELRLSIAPGAIGHAFPTGDVFRQVEIRVVPIDTSGRALDAGASTILGRTFGPGRGGHEGMVRVQRSDSRLVGPRTFVLPMPGATRRARWQIVWQRLPPWLATRLGMVMSEHETVVLEGTVSR